MGKINMDKFDGSNPIRHAQQQGAVKKSDNAASTVSVKQTAAEDKLDLSSRASEVGRFVDQLKDLPDVRQEKVSSLRERVQTGSYNPTGEEIADAILKDER